MLYFPITHQEISVQIARLLNDYSQLSKKRAGHDILNSNTDYVVETHGKFVIGVAGIQKVSHELSELKHMVVHPAWRKKGLGHFVAKRSMVLCKTPSIYATVRTGNKASLRALDKLGFVRTHDRDAGDHQLTVLVRVSPKCLRKSRASRSSFPVVSPTLVSKSSLDSYPR